MFTVEQEAKLEELWELRRKNLQVLDGITEGGDIVKAALAQAAQSMSTAAGRRAPRLTGTLQSAHRGELMAGYLGRVFISPTVQNPVFGGYPVEYGPIVHERKPWFDQTIISDGQAILGYAGEMIFGRIGDIWND